LGASREKAGGPALTVEQIEFFMNALKRFWSDHPALSNWALLSVGMVIILLISARNVGFNPSQWLGLIAATVTLAGLSAWIISWET